MAREGLLLTEPVVDQQLLDEGLELILSVPGGQRSVFMGRYIDAVYGNALVNEGIATNACSACSAPFGEGDKVMVLRYDTRLIAPLCSECVLYLAHEISTGN